MRIVTLALLGITTMLLGKTLKGKCQEATSQMKKIGNKTKNLSQSKSHVKKEKVMKFNKIKAIAVIGALLFLAGCSSTPEEVSEEMNKKIIAKEICVYPDGGYTEAPGWICSNKGPMESVGQYSIKNAGYQHARNMAYTQALREIASNVNADIRSMIKNYTGVTGTDGATTANHADEDVIKNFTFQVLKGAHIEDYIISPKKDLYVLVKIGEVPDMPSNIGNAKMWQEFKAKQAHDELDREYEKFIKSQNPMAAEPQPVVQQGEPAPDLSQILQDAKQDPQNY